MSRPRRLILDTDTGSDDVWAIVEALRAPDILQVEAITVVCGNLPLDMCVKNAMLAADAAGARCPPVYRGMEHPLLSKEAAYAFEVHGQDGLSGMDLPWPERPVERKRACDAIIDLVMENPGEIEIATIGPLTNIAMAFLLEPRAAGCIKKLWILGGSASGRGNMSEHVEYNVGVDPEAAAIVAASGADTLWVTWDTAQGDTEITPDELEALSQCGDPAAAFCARCIRDMQAWQRKEYGRDSVGVIDAMLMTAVLYPEVMEDVLRTRCSVELAPGDHRGYFRMEGDKEPNAHVCTRISAGAYKDKLFALLGLR